MPSHYEYWIEYDSEERLAALCMKNTDTERDIVNVDMKGGILRGPLVLERINHEARSRGLHNLPVRPWAGRKGEKV